MLEAKILRIVEPHEKITFFNNLHIIRKKDKSIRPILDCRILNLYVDYEGSEYFSHLKMLSLLPENAKISKFFRFGVGLPKYQN